MDRLSGSASLPVTEDVFHHGKVPQLLTYETYKPDHLSQVAGHGLSYVMENIAASLTKAGMDLSNEAVEGHVITSEVFVLVRWNWLILPIILEAAGLFVLITAMVISRRNEVLLWKDSILPLLYHGLEREDGAISRDVCRMEELAQEEVVKLDKSGGDGDRVMLRT